ncbi:hypothetical protein, partial [Nocardia barduliensis]|uniref:hypothetical protein n=1 Tax=Nocardia barduliensis TaxID=2736643 RepID=UPI001C2D1C1C
MPELRAEAPLADAATRPPVLLVAGLALPRRRAGAVADSPTRPDPAVVLAADCCTGPPRPPVAAGSARLPGLRRADFAGAGA